MNRQFNPVHEQKSDTDNTNIIWSLQWMSLVKAGAPGEGLRLRHERNKEKIVKHSAMILEGNSFNWFFSYTCTEQNNPWITSQILV